MKQIYNFEQNSPPVINESRIREEIERRKLQRETALLAMGSMLTVLCFMLLTLKLYGIAPVLAAVCTVYAGISVTGGSVIALVFANKRRSLIKCSEQQ